MRKKHVVNVTLNTCQNWVVIRCSFTFVLRRNVQTKVSEEILATMLTADPEDKYL